MTHSLTSKINIYLPADIAAMISEDAHATNMNLSEFMFWKILEGYQILEKYDSFSNLSKSSKYRTTLKSFNPPKPGPKLGGHNDQKKKMITFRFRDEIFEKIGTLRETYNLNNSNIVELILRIVYYDRFNGMPLKRIVLNDPEVSMLRNIINDTGAKSISHFLAACRFEEVGKTIKHWLPDDWDE